MSETGIMRDILVRITELPGAMFYRQNAGVGVTRAGTILHAGVAGCPDITGCYRGRAVGIEVKSPTGRQSEPQRRFQAAWERAGGLYVLARSVAEALAALEAIP